MAQTAAVAAITKIFLADIERLLCAAAGGMIDADTPAPIRPRLHGISFLHRFGSAVNQHVLLHACVTDGVFMPTSTGSPAFLPARPIPPGRPGHAAATAPEIILPPSSTRHRFLKQPVRARQIAIARPLAPQAGPLRWDAAAIATRCQA